MQKDDLTVSSSAERKHLDHSSITVAILSSMTVCVRDSIISGSGVCDATVVPESPGGRGRNNGTGVDGSSPEKWGSCWSSIISMMLRTSTLRGVDTFSFVTMDWLFDFGVLGTS